MLFSEWAPPDGSLKGPRKPAAEGRVPTKEKILLSRGGAAPGESPLETQAAEVCTAGRGPLDLEEIEALRALFLLLDRWDREDTAHGE